MHFISYTVSMPPVLAKYAVKFFTERKCANRAVTETRLESLDAELI